MALRDTVTKWHTAMCLLEQKHLREAASKLHQICQPSAKILYNLGSIGMLQKDYTGAIQHFSTSIDQDKYLAIAYYQRGVCYHEVERYDRAELDFLTAQSMIPSEGIDYRQLGADFILTNTLMEQCVSVTRNNYHSKQQHTRLPVLPVMNCIFQPPKKLVENLVKQDFLGRAKVISSTLEQDIVYAASKRQTLSPNDELQEPKSVSLPPSPVAPRSQQSPVKANKVLVPPLPSRPPPRLPKGTSRHQAIRTKSKSMEDILSDGPAYEDLENPPSITVNAPHFTHQAVHSSNSVAVGNIGVHTTQQTVGSKLKKPESGNSEQVLPPGPGIHQGLVQSAVFNENKSQKSLSSHSEQRNGGNNKPPFINVRKSALNSDSASALPKSLSNVIDSSDQDHSAREGHAMKMKLLFEGRAKETSTINLNVNQTLGRVDAASQQGSRTAQSLQPSSAMQSRSISPKSPKPARPPPPKFTK